MAHGRWRHVVDRTGFFEENEPSLRTRQTTE